MMGKRKLLEKEIKVVRVVAILFAIFWAVFSIAGYGLLFIDFRVGITAFFLSVYMLIFACMSLVKFCYLLLLKNLGGKLK